MTSTSGLLALLGTALLASTAWPAAVAVNYTVEQERLREAVADTPLIFELHSDAACSAPIHTQEVAAGTIGLIEQVRTFRVRGAARTARLARLSHVLTGAPDAISYFLRKRPGRAKTDPGAAKVPVSIRLDGAVLAQLRTEARRLGIGYQTFVGSILHRYVNRELVDLKAADLRQLLERAS